MISFFAFIENEEQRRFCERLYLEYGRDMLNIAYSVLGDHGLAEDAVHNAFVYVADCCLEELGRRSESERKHFLLLTAKHRALNRLKRRRFEIPTDPGDELLTGSGTDEDALDRLARECGQNELEARLNELPAIYRDTLYLSFFLGLGGGEIARLMETEPQTVWKRAERGKKLLRELLERGGERDE